MHKCITYMAFTQSMFYILYNINKFSLIKIKNIFNQIAKKETKSQIKNF